MGSGVIRPLADTREQGAMHRKLKETAGFTRQLTPEVDWTAAQFVLQLLG